MPPVRDETGITVTPTYAGNYSETLTKAMIALRAGKGPQLAMFLAAEMHSLQDSGILAPLDALGPVDAAWIDSFYPAFLANSRAGGKIWSIPFQRSTAIAYCNKAAFKDVGLDPDIFPKTWAEMQDAGQRLTKKDPSGRFPAAGVAKSYLPVATGELSTYENQRVYKLLTDNIQSVLGGSLAPAQAMANVQEAADRLLKPYRT